MIAPLEGVWGNRAEGGDLEQLTSLSYQRQESDAQEFRCVSWTAQLEEIACPGIRERQEP